jgi:hypothetical protein
MKCFSSSHAQCAVARLAGQLRLQAAQQQQEIDQLKQQMSESASEQVKQLVREKTKVELSAQRNQKARDEALVRCTPPSLAHPTHIVQHVAVGRLPPAPTASCCA